MSILLEEGGVGEVVEKLCLAMPRGEYLKWKGGGSGFHQLTFLLCFRFLPTPIN